MSQLLSSRCKRRAPADRSRRFRPALETLEERLAPAFDLVVSVAPTNGVSKVTAQVARVGPVTTFTAIAAGANLSSSDIVAELRAGHRVVVTSGTGGAQAGNITVNASLNDLPSLGHAADEPPGFLRFVSGSNSTVGDIFLTKDITNYTYGLDVQALALRHLRVTATYIVAGHVTLQAGTKADHGGDGSVGTLTVNVARLGRDVSLRGADIEIEQYVGVLLRPANLEPPISILVAPPGYVTVYGSLASRPMSIGGSNSAVVGVNLTDGELARINAWYVERLTFGHDFQTGDVILTTAWFSGVNTSVFVTQATTGSGKIVLDDEGVRTAVNGERASVHLLAGTGGIVAATASGPGIATIATSGARVELATNGPVGSSSRPIKLADQPDSLRQIVAVHGRGYYVGDEVFSRWVYGVPSGVFLKGLGTLTVGELEGGTIQVDAARDLYVTGAISGGPAELRVGTATLVVSTATFKSGAAGSNILLVGDAGDVLRGPDGQSSTFKLAENGTRTLTTARLQVVFQGFATWIGGDQDDTFRFESVPSPRLNAIDGGRGQDALVFTGTEPALTVNGPGSVDGYLGKAPGMVYFDNIDTFSHSPLTLVFGVAADSGQAYVGRFNLTGAQVGAFAQFAPGVFTKIIAVPDPVTFQQQTVVFGLSVDQGIYAAVFDSDGKLKIGWARFNVGTFTDLAAASLRDDPTNISEIGLFALGTDGQIHGLRFHTQGTLMREWSVVAPGQFVTLAAATVAADRALMVFGVGADQQIYAAELREDPDHVSFRLDHGFFPVGSGAFRKVTLGQASDGSLTAFGLGVDRQVYAAKFNLQGNLAYGWFQPSAGLFDDIVAPSAVAGDLSGFLLSTAENVQAQRRVQAALFAPDGQLRYGWVPLTKNLFASLGKTGYGQTPLLGVAAEGADSFGGPLDFDFLTASPGPYRSISLAF